MKSSPRPSHRAPEDWGLECALPSRELRLAQPGRATRAPAWRRALDWIKALGRNGPAPV